MRSCRSLIGNVLIIAAILVTLYLFYPMYVSAFSGLHFTF